MAFNVYTGEPDGTPLPAAAQLGLEPPPTNEGWRPAYNAWQAFAIKVLADNWTEDLHVRQRFIEEQGGSSFYEFSVPQAIISLTESGYSKACVEISPPMAVA